MGKITESINGKFEDFGKAILTNIDELGLGAQSKSDFEAFLLHQLFLITDSSKVRDSYDWMRILKITPSKFRSLQMIRSAKYLNLDLDNKENWRLILNALDGKKLETEDKENGKARIYIDDLYVHRLIERFIVMDGSSVDYTLNKNQLVIKYNEFLKLLDSIYRKAEQKPLIDAINEDKSKLGIEKKFNSLENVLKDMKKVLQDKTYEEIAESALTSIIKIVRKKLGL